MAASPPPPPPPRTTPPPAPALPTGATTIAKYIARFRHESPRPRDARATAPREDFWWLEAGPPEAVGGNGTHNDELTTPTAAAAVSASSSSLRSVMDWELELLSGASEEDASVATRTSIDDDRSATSATATSTPWRHQPSSASVSPQLSSENERSRHGHSFVRRQRRDEDDDEPVVVVDDGFVVLPSDAQREDAAMLAASLEDPEMVIQRIRRRLGFQPPPSAVVSSRHASYGDDDNKEEEDALPKVPSAWRDEDRFDLLPNHFDGHATGIGAVGSSHVSLAQETVDATEDRDRHSLLLDLSMSLDDIESSRGNDTPISSAVSLESPVSYRVSADLLSLDETMQQQADPVAVSRVKEVPSGSSEEEETKSEDEVCPCDVVPSPDDELVINDGASHDEGVQEEPPAPSPNDLPVSSALQTAEGNEPISQVVEEKSVRSAEVKRCDVKDAKLLPAVEERRSPRLPPLSPARGPVFKPAASITPRALDASEPPEVTAETAKTLDSLLSFVVHSWGENSFFSSGGSDDGEPSPSSTGGDSIPQLPPTESSFTTSDPEMSAASPVLSDHSQEEHNASEGGGSNSLVDGYEEGDTVAGSDYIHDTNDADDINDTNDAADIKDINDTNNSADIKDTKDTHGINDTTTFATDPVVTMLRERIELFEAALHRLDNADET